MALVRSGCRTDSVNSSLCGTCQQKLSHHPSSGHRGWTLQLLWLDMAALCSRQPGASPLSSDKGCVPRGGSSLPARWKHGPAGMHPVLSCPWQHGHGCLLVPSTGPWRSGRTGAALGGWWLDNCLMITMREREQIPPVVCEITL